MSPRRQEERNEPRDIAHNNRVNVRTRERRCVIVNDICSLTRCSLISATELISYPKHSRPRSLRAAGLYHLIFTFLSEQWRQDLTLVMDTSFAEEGSPFVALRVPFYSHIVVAGLRYGASTMPRGQGNRYAYINGRQAVQIDHIIRIDYETSTGHRMTADLAVVRRFVATSASCYVPWASR